MMIGRKLELSNHADNWETPEAHDGFEDQINRRPLIPYCQLVRFLVPHGARENQSSH